MTKIYNNVIEITRGADTDLRFKAFAMYQTAAPVEITNAIFSVKKEIDDTDYIITKTLDANGRFTITHNDTKNLALGVYYWAVTIEENGKKRQPNKGKFIVSWNGKYNE